MRTGMMLAQGTDFTTLKGWMSNANGTGQAARISLANVDYSDLVAVRAVRDSIPSWEVWDDIVDGAFLDRRAPDALRAIASIIVCQQAAVWSRQHAGAQPAPGLSMDDLLAAQVELFSLLSPSGLSFMTDRRDVAAGGIRYMPQTGDAEVDDLLETIVSEPVITALLALPGASYAANTLNAHAEAWRNLAPQRERAEKLRMQAKRARDCGDFFHAAHTLERAAMVWSRADESGRVAAQTLCHAASNWKIIGGYDRAAMLQIHAAKMWTVAGQPDDAAQAYAAAAGDLNLADRPDLAKKMYGEEAQSWEAADDLPFAAVAWQRAGSPDRAARLWKQAWHDADEDATAADIAVNAAALFNVVMESEGVQHT